MAEDEEEHLDAALQEDGDEESEGGQEEQEEEEEDDDDVGDDIMLPDLMSQNDPLRMVLTTEEEDRAVDIKFSIEQDPELDNLSDYMYAQLALICKENTADAVERARGLQHFRQEYNIVDSPSFGRQALHKMMHLMPNFILHFGFNDQDGNYMMSFDLARFDTAPLKTGNRFEQYLIGSYFLAHCAFPDLEAIRKGMISTVECDGVDWARKSDFKIIQRVFNELWSCYPFAGTTKHYHTSVFFNLMGTLLKKVLPKDNKDAFEFGCNCDGRLDALCLVPTPEEATLRVLQEMQLSLIRRFENERNFVLNHNVPA